MVDLSTDTQIYRDYYEEKAQEEDKAYLERGDWGSKEAQELRFCVLCEIMPPTYLMGNNPSILDVGCGAGDLYGYLIKQVPADRDDYISSHYCGIDVSLPIIGFAATKYPNVNFVCGDILAHQLARQWDYVLSSGVFSLPSPNHETYVQTMLVRMFELCRIGVAVNFPSLCAPHPCLHLQYYDPCKMMNFVLGSISSMATLRHDYKDNDFTIYIYKEA